MAYKIIACEVMKSELLAVKAGTDVDFVFVEMGLHLHPARLHEELQKIIDDSSGYERVVLAFGLCGGAAHNLRAPGCTLTIPKI